MPIRLWCPSCYAELRCRTHLRNDLVYRHPAPGHAGRPIWCPGGGQEPLAHDPRRVALTLHIAGAAVKVSITAPDGATAARVEQLLRQAVEPVCRAGAPNPRHWQDTDR